MKRPRGRPPKPIVVPHPLKSGEWLLVGRYDKHWPAVNWAWCQIRDGMPQKQAMAAAAEKFKVKENSLYEWVDRARTRGPLAESDYPEEYPEDDVSN